MNRQGFTLIELLVAMSILGIILAALLSLTTGTLTFSAVSVSSSDRLRELSDVTGYIGDNVRRASDLSQSYSFNATNLECNNVNPSTGNYPCLAMIVPRVDGTGNAINAYQFLAYRIEDRNTLGSDYKIDDPWADTNTTVIREYRKTLCDADIGTTTIPACGTADFTKFSAVSSVTGAQPSLVFDGLRLTGSGSNMYVYGTTEKPFVVDTSSGTVSLNLQAVQRRRGTERYTPSASTVYSLEVTKRN